MAEDQEKANAPTPTRLCACGKPTRKNGRGRYRAQCSACESKGEEQLRENLVVTVVEKTKLKARIQKLEQDLSERNEENTQLERAIADMKPVIKQLEARLTEINEALASAGEHKGEIERLEALLSRTQEEAGHLRRDSQKKIDTLDAEAETQKRINKGLMLKLLEKDRLLSSQAGELEDQAEKNKLLSDQACEAEGRMESLNGVMASSQILLESRRLKILRVSEELEEVKAENESLQDKLEATRASLSESVLAERAAFDVERAEAAAERQRLGVLQDQAVADLLEAQAKLSRSSKISLVQLGLWICLVVKILWSSL